MPFLDHLEELRWRIIYAIVSLVVCIAVGFWVTLKFDLVEMLAAPVLPLLPEHALVYTHPADKMTIYINVATTIGLVFAAPMVLYQFWEFVRPALQKHERRVVLGVLYFGLLLFAAGAALAQFVVIPISLPWLFSFGSKTLIPLITVGEYFSFVASMVLTFGLSFELPIVVLALSAFGIVTPQLLTRFRRHAFVLIVIAGAFLTPGDMVMTTIALSVPLYLLYELSVLASMLVARHKARRANSLRAGPATS
ncbi:MAG TPA: twin-arginine translocase subunit TatC [Gemmatimonadaceae bacterium]